MSQGCGVPETEGSVTALFGRETAENQESRVSSKPTTPPSTSHQIPAYPSSPQTPQLPCTVRSYLKVDALPLAGRNNPPQP